MIATQGDSTLVCGRWPLPLRPGTGGFYEYLHTASSRNAACFLNLLDGIPQGLYVVEHFGGVGMFSTIIQNVIQPRSHSIFDIDPDCVAQLQSAFESTRGVTASQGDALATMGTVRADLLVLDFAYATIKHHNDWPWGLTLGTTKPRYVIWSDTALRRLGLHRGLYSKIFGTPIVSHSDYVLAYSRFMWERYGYSVTRVAHHVYSYLLAEPVPFSDEIPIVKVA